MANQSRIQSTTAADNLIFAYESLKNADIQSADFYLENALKEDFEHPEVLLALKCMAFWKDQLSKMPETKKSSRARRFFMCILEEIHGLPHAHRRHL